MLNEIHLDITLVVSVKTVHSEPMLFQASP